jgi:hypothetical protein
MFYIKLNIKGQSTDYLLHIEYSLSTSECNNCPVWTYRDFRISPVTDPNTTLVDLDPIKKGGCNFTGLTVNKAIVMLGSWGNVNVTFWDGIDDHNVQVAERGQSTPDTIHPIDDGLIITDGYYESKITGAFWHSGTANCKVTAYQIPKVNFENVYTCITTRDTKEIGMYVNTDKSGVAPNAIYYMDIATEPLKRRYRTYWPYNEVVPDMQTINITSSVQDKTQNYLQFSWNDLTGPYSNAWWGKTLYVRVRADFSGFSSCYNDTLHCDPPFQRQCTNDWYGPSPGTGYVINNSRITNVIQKFPEPNKFPIPPKCYKGTDAAITLTFVVDDISKYVFSIHKLVKKSNPTDNCSETNGAGGVGNPNDPAYCFTGEGASITGTISNNTFTIDNNVLADNPNDLNGSGLKGYFGAGDYELAIETASGISCPSYTILTIPEPPQLVLESATPKNSYTWADTTYQIKGYGATDDVLINLSGGTGPYKYSIDNGLNYIENISSTSYTYTGVSAGSKTIKIKDVNDCPTQNNRTIPIEMRQPYPLEISASSVTFDTVSCHRDDYYGNRMNGKIQLHINGGIGPFDVALNDASNVVSPHSTNDVQIPNSLYAIPYNIIVNDNYISSNSLTVTVPSHAPLVINPIPETNKKWPDCIGGANGSVNVSGYGGVSYDGTYHFKIYENGVTSPIDSVKEALATLNNLEAHKPYIIFIQDDLECGNILRDVIIPENPRPVRPVLADTIHPTCYTYSDGKVNFTHRNGVSLSTDTSIHEFNYVLNNIKGTPNYSQEYDNCDTAKFDGLKKGWYRVEISDFYRCPINYAYRDSFFISEPKPIVIKTDVTPASRKGEHNGSITFSFTGGSKNYVYQWYDVEADSLIAEGATKDSAVISGLGKGSYKLMVHDTCKCTNGRGEADDSPWLEEGPVNVGEPERELSFKIREHKNVSCNGLSNGKITIEGDGGWGNNYRYGLKQDSLTFDGEFNNLRAGLYTLYVSDQLNEVFHDTVRVTEPALLTASVTTALPARCFGNSDGSFNLTVSGGTQPYYVSMDNNLHKIQSTSMAGLTAGTYNILVTDSNLCEYTLQVSISQPDPLNITLNTLVNTYCRDSIGRLSVTCTGGIPAYTYQWTNDKHALTGSSDAIEHLPAGIYRLSVTDQNQCSLQSPLYTISNTDGPIIADTIITAVSCYGYSDGNAHVTVENGTPDYNYLWSNGQNTALATGLRSGDYVVTVTDNNNCSNYASLYIPTPDSLTIIATSVNNPQCYNYTNGNIEITGNGGTPSYQYTWNTGNTGSNNTGLRAGGYSATITDAHQCTTTGTFVLTNPEPVIVNLGKETTICTGQTVNLDAGEFTAYNWTSDNSFSSSARTVKLTDQGNYYLQVLDAHGCLGKDTFTIHTSNSLLDAVFLIKSDAFTGDTVVAIDISWPIPDSVYWVYDRNLINSKSEKDYESLIFRTPGTYLITMYAALGNCRDNFTHEITIREKSNEKSLQLGAKEPLIQNFIVHPNPNTGSFTVEVTLREESDITLQLFNFSTLMNKKELKGLKDYVTEYNIPNLSAGVYVLQVMAGNEQKMVKMIVY